MCVVFRPHTNMAVQTSVCVGHTGNSLNMNDNKVFNETEGCIVVYDREKPSNSTVPSVSLSHTEGSAHISNIGLL